MGGPARVDGPVWREPTVLWIALALTLANIFKPLVVDDTAYYQLARHIASNPLDPYGFAIFWRDVPEPAIQLLAPPVLPYWWACALTLFGDTPILWKLWLFPFAHALSGALFALSRRFARGFEGPLVCLCVLSPTVLPQFNLMLDVPALALSLCAMESLARAVEKGSRRWALCAGLLAGLALQTKYTSVFAMMSLVFYAGLFRQPRLGVLAVAMAGAAFAAWETFLIFQYGSSHFLVALLHGQGTAVRHGFGDLNIEILTNLGAAAPALGLLACMVLGVRTRILMAAILAITVVFAAIPALPPRPIAALMFEPRFTPRNIEIYLFLPLGIFVAGSLSWAVTVALRSELSLLQRRSTLFLLAWVVLEVVGIWWMTPFMAARRVMPLVVGSTLLLGASLAATRGTAAVQQRGGSIDPLRSLRGIAAWSAALAAVYAIADFSDAWTRMRAVDRIHAVVEELGGDPARENLWVAGHWGYQFYTERRGMKQLIAGRSQLRTGDWVVTAQHVARQRLPKIGGLSEPLAIFDAVSPWPWSTLPYAYAGAMPLRAQPGAQLRITIQRVRKGSTLAPLSNREAR